MATISMPWEEELKKRILAARSAGWNEKDISKFALQDVAQRQQQTKQRTTRRSQQSKPQEDKGFLSSLISEAGGIGGALGGAAAGTAIMPGVGTLIGAGLGGLLGGTGGSAVEQQVRDDKVDIGKALKEGSLEGLFGFGPIRAGKLAFRGGEALFKGAGKEGVREAGEKVLNEGMLSRSGRTLRGEARGIGPGEKLGGTRIGPQTEKELNKFMENNIGAKRGSASKQLEKVEDFIGKKNDELSGAISKSNRVLTMDEKNKLANDLVKNFDSKIVGASKRQADIRDDLVTRIQQSRTIADFDDLRKVIDENVNFARNAASPEPAAEQVYKLFRKGLTDDVASKVGAAKTLKKDLSKAFSVQDLLLNKASKPGSGLSPAGITFPGRATQSAQSNLGGLIESIGRSGARPAGTASRVLTGSAINTMSQPQQGTQQGTQQGEFDPFEQFTQLNDQATQEISPQDLINGGGGEIDSGLSVGSSELFNAAIEAFNAGDIDAYEELATLSDMASGLESAELEKQEQLAELQGGGDDDGKMQTAQTIVDNLMDVYETIGGPQGVYSGAASNVLGTLNVGEQNERARAYEQNRLSYLTPIIKAFGEVGVLTDKDREVVAKAIPSITDTPAQAQQKRNLLYTMIQSLSSQQNEEDPFDQMRSMFESQQQYNYNQL